MKFDWDENKNKINIEKHKVSFEEASTIFLNEIIEEPDIKHSELEERFVAIGVSAYLRELVVCYCKRIKLDNEEYTHIITARKANDEERSQYYDGR